MRAAVEAPVREPHRAQLGRADGAARAVGVAEVGPPHGATVAVNRGGCGAAAAAPAARPAATTSAARRIGPDYSGGTVLLATLLAALTAACPANLANDLRAQPSATQLITVEAASTRATHASLRLWRRSGACWVDAGGPYPARLGWNGLSASRREGDGTTPAGTFRIHPTMYGIEANPGVRFRYTRVRCGDWWDEDASSPTYNTFRRVGCGRRPPFAVSDGCGRTRAPTRTSP